MGCPELPIEYFSGPSGKRKSLVVAFADGSKKVTEWSYDKFGRLEKIKDNGKEVVYTYDFKSRLAEKSLPGGLFESYDYDSQNRLVRKALQGRAGLAETAENKNPKPIAELKYFYSKDGMITAREVNGKLQNYEYDLKGQLTGVKDKDENYVEQYVYDPAGNILKKIVDGKTIKFVYDKANQLATATLPDGTKKIFEYDGAGRMTKEGDKTYAYGWMDKVIQTNDDRGLSSFDYYPDGQLAEVSRAFQSDNSPQTENFVWDGLALIKRDKIDYTVEPAVTGGIAIFEGNKILFNDKLGSSLGTAENGVYSEIPKTSFGEQLSNSRTSELSNFSSDFFTGKPNIEGLGYSFLFRNYKPEIGKWQTVDPMGYPDGWNNLAYVNNKVSSKIDALGLCRYYDDDYIFWVSSYDTHHPNLVPCSTSPQTETDPYDTYWEVSAFNINFQCGTNNVPVGAYGLLGEYIGNFPNNVTYTCAAELHTNRNGYITVGFEIDVLAAGIYNVWPCGRREYIGIEPYVNGFGNYSYQLHEGIVGTPHLCE